MSLSQKIKEAVIKEGFSVVGITKAEYLEVDAEYFSRWLEAGKSAAMNYLKNNSDKRFDVSRLVPGAKSVIVVGLDYRSNSKRNSSYKIAKYARVEDYHYVIKAKLNNVLTQFPELQLPTQQIFCDSAPLLERSLAKKAGIGRVGKNTTLINDKIGSFMFLGELVSPIDLDCDQELQGNPCVNCTKCIEACPAKAISENAGIDARKCLSYLTIESKEDIRLHPIVRQTKTLFGCDICQDVCPWNKKAHVQTNSCNLKMMPYSEWDDVQWQSLDKEMFNSNMKNSPLKRAGYNKIRACLDFIDSKE